MWHTMEFVAESRRLDAKALEAFALAGEDTYGIARERGCTEVNTWHVDALVKDFVAAASLSEGYTGAPAQASDDQKALVGGEPVWVVYENPHPGHAHRGDGVFVKHVSRGECGGQWDSYVDVSPMCLVKVKGNARACFPLPCVSRNKVMAAV